MEDAQNDRIGWLLGRCYALWREGTYARQDAAGYGDIRPAHSPVFRLLDADGRRVSDLASQAGMTKQSMAYLVEDLTRLGYLETRPDPADGRAKLIVFTAQGARAQMALATASIEVETELAADLGQDEVDRLRSLLRAVLDEGRAA